MSDLDNKLLNASFFQSQKKLFSKTIGHVSYTDSYCSFIEQNAGKLRIDKATVKSDCV